jgi:hypothetical protein
MESSTPSLVGNLGFNAFGRPTNIPAQAELGRATLEGKIVVFGWASPKYFPTRSELAVVCMCLSLPPKV